jgi:hypothetical protein
MQVAALRMIWENDRCYVAMHIAMTRTQLVVAHTKLLQRLTLTSAQWKGAPLC